MMYRLLMYDLYFLYNCVECWNDIWGEIEREKRNLNADAGVNSTMCITINFSSTCHTASHGLSLLFPSSLFSISICFVCLFFISACSLILSSICSMSSFITYYTMVYFLFLICFLLLSSLAYFLLSFCHFKLLVQFSSRAVVGLKATQWLSAPVRAPQAVVVGSFPRTLSPHGQGWPSRLPSHPLCTLCPASPLWPLVGWAVACQSTMPLSRAAPTTFPAPSTASALSPSYVRAITRPRAAYTAASGTSWTSSRMLHHWRPANTMDTHPGPICLTCWEPCSLNHSKALGFPMVTTTVLGADQVQVLVSGHLDITRRQRRKNGASMALNQPF